MTIKLWLSYEWEHFCPACAKSVFGWATEKDIEREDADSVCWFDPAKQGQHSECVQCGEEFFVKGIAKPKPKPVPGCHICGGEVGEDGRGGLCFDCCHVHGAAYFSGFMG